MRDIFTTLEKKRKRVPRNLLQDLARVDEAMDPKLTTALAGDDDVAVWDAAEAVEDGVKQGRITPREALAWVAEAKRRGHTVLEWGTVERAAIMERDLTPILRKIRGKRTVHVRAKSKRLNVNNTIIHPSSRGDRGLQISSFDRKMEPWGHRMWSGSMEDALRDVWREDGPFTLVDVAESLQEALSQDTHLRDLERQAVSGDLDANKRLRDLQKRRLNPYSLEAMLLDDLPDDMVTRLKDGTLVMLEPPNEVRDALRDGGRWLVDQLGRGHSGGAPYRHYRAALTPLVSNQVRLIAGVRHVFSGRNWHALFPGPAWWVSPYGDTPTAGVLRPFRGPGAAKYSIITAPPSAEAVFALFPQNEEAAVETAATLEEAMPASARISFDSAPYANMRLLDVARLLQGAAKAKRPNVSLITKLVDRLVHALEFTIYAIQGRPEGHRIGTMIRGSFNDLTDKLPTLAMGERQQVLALTTQLNETLETLDIGPVEGPAR